MCLCGSSESGKAHLIMNMLTQNNGIFQTRFEKNVYFYRFWQPVYDRFMKKCSAKFFFEDCSDLKKFSVGTSWKTNPLHKFSSPVKLPSQQSSIDSLIENLDHQMKDSGFQLVSGNDKVLALFDDSCDDILESSSFANLATAGWHKSVSVISIKHNLYQRGKYFDTVDRHTTHVVILKSPRIGRQLKFLGSELRIVDSAFLEAAYQQATSIPFGHLLIDFTTTCYDSWRFCTRICNFVNSFRGRHNYSLTSQKAPPRKSSKFLKNISKTEFYRIVVQFLLMNYSYRRVSFYLKKCCFSTLAQLRPKITQTEININMLN